MRSSSNPPTSWFGNTLRLGTIGGLKTQQLIAEPLKMACSPRPALRQFAALRV
jgi:hypothetical protein